MTNIRIKKNHKQSRGIKKERKVHYRKFRQAKQMAELQNSGVSHVEPSEGQAHTTKVVDVGRVDQADNVGIIDIVDGVDRVDNANRVDSIDSNVYDTGRTPDAEFAAGIREPFAVYSERYQEFLIWLRKHQQAARRQHQKELGKGRARQKELVELQEKDWDDRRRQMERDQETYRKQVPVKTEEQRRERILKCVIKQRQNIERHRQQAAHYRRIYSQWLRHQEEQQRGRTKQLEQEQQHLWQRLISPVRLRMASMFSSMQRRLGNDGRQD